MIRVKKTLKPLVLFVATLAILVSCASKPKPPAPEPTPEPVVTQPVTPEPTPPAPSISQDELDKLLAEAKGLKKKAFDLKLFEVLPDDYKAADALFAQAQKAYDDKDAPNAKEGLDSTIAAYKDLIARGVDELVASTRKAAGDIKALAEKVGAESSQAERFGAGDERYAAAEALVADSKAEEAIAVFGTARLYYELAWKKAMAADLRATIEEKDFAKWDSGNFQLADQKYQAEDGFWASGQEADRASGADALDESILRFNLVIQKGRETVAESVKETTDAAKKRSDDIKANVASKDLYGSAVKLYNEGSSELAAKNYEAAAESFDRAGAAFDLATDDASMRLEAAKAAMEAADEAAKESLRKAQEADRLIQAAN